MEPIISPWFFYLLHVCTVAHVVAVTFFVLAISFFTTAAIGRLITHADEDNYSDSILAAWKKLFRRSVPILLICTLLAIAIPSKKTVIWMMVTKHITSDNVQKAVEAGDIVRETIKQDILEILGTIKTKESKR